METKLFDKHSIIEAAKLLRSGQIVAFPTETVFGLGAIATDERAVSQVFVAKNRPKDNPLIVHIGSPIQLLDFVENISPLAHQLMEAFWPGPLTIIFPYKKGSLAPSVTPHKETVAVRMPNHRDALELIEKTGLPLVGPSANKSSKPSPTLWEHVLQDFEGEIAGILRPVQKLSKIGVESTVVLPQKDKVLILRPGAITKEAIEELGIQVEELSANKQLKSNQDLMAPGVKYRHYSPKQPVWIISESKIDQIETLIKMIPKKVAVQADDRVIDRLIAANLHNLIATYKTGPKGDIASATQHLYAGMRQLEKSDCEVMIIQGYEDTPQSHALLNRLTKAASKVIK